MIKNLPVKVGDTRDMGSIPGSGRSPEVRSGRGIQAASCVGPGKSNLPFELRRKAGHCSRVTDACVQKPMFLSRGDRDLGVAFQTHPVRQAFI